MNGWTSVNRKIMSLSDVVWKQDGELVDLWDAAWAIFEDVLLNDPDAQAQQMAAMFQVVFNLHFFDVVREDEL